MDPSSDKLLDHAIDLIERLGGRFEPVSGESVTGWCCRLAAAFHCYLPGVATPRLLGWPRRDLLTDWLGPRWIAAVPAMRNTSLATVASSRLGRCWRRRARWMTVLRQAVSLAGTRTTWVAGHRTAAGDWLQHVADRAGQSCWSLRAFSPEESQRREPSVRTQVADRGWCRWLDAVRTLDSPSQLLLSPPAIPAEAPALPGRLTDRATWALSDLVLCLSRRRGGAIDSLAQHHRRYPLGRLVDFHSDDSWEWPQWDELATGLRRPRVITQLPWPALAHWVRGCHEAWPGESDADWRDRLVLTASAADATPLSTLRKIVAERRVRASRRLSTDVPLVCWTAQPPQQWAQCRAFRRHRSRWDFEPYGIAVAREAIIRRGGRPVTYVPRSDWESVPRECRPFAQIRYTKEHQIDWSIEREWRSPGDFHLESLASDQWAVIVARPADAWCVAVPGDVAVLVLHPHLH